MILSKIVEVLILIILLLKTSIRTLDLLLLFLPLSVLFIYQ
jgi:hypothetical protein